METEDFNPEWLTQDVLDQHEREVYDDALEVL